MPPPRPSYCGGATAPHQPCPQPLPFPPPSSSSPGGVYRVRILKMRYATLGMAIEGGANTQQSLPRIIAIRPEGAAFQTGGECLRQDARAEDGSFSFVAPPSSAFKTQDFVEIHSNSDAIFHSHARVGQVIKEVDGRNLQGRDREVRFGNTPQFRLF